MSIALGTGLAIAGVGASIGGAAIASHGATSAANTQAKAATDAATLQKQAADADLAFQKQQYSDAQTREAPYIASGTAALGQLNAMPGFQAPTAADAQNDPGYAFRIAQGQKAIENSAAAKGTALGGGELKSLDSYTQGAASDEYSNVYARRFNEYNNQFNQLASKAGLGQTATGTLDTIGSNAATQSGNTLVSSANSQAQEMNNAAAARASGYVNSSNALGTAVKSGTNSILDWFRASRPPGPVLTGAPYEPQDLTAYQ